VTITLCDPPLPGPSFACPQNCATQDDCDDNQTCNPDKKCIIPRRNVQITSAQAAGVSDPVVVASDGTLYRPDINLTCDPTVGFVNIVPPFCARTGSGDPDVQFELLVTCTEDSSTGGVATNTVAQLLQGCDPDTKFLTKVSLGLIRFRRHSTA